jgi:hypothetical protein
MASPALRSSTSSDVALRKSREFGAPFFTASSGIERVDRRGVYFHRFTTGSHSESKKMLLLK